MANLETADTRPNSPSDLSRLPSIPILPSSASSSSSSSSSVSSRRSVLLESTVVSQPRRSYPAPLKDHAESTRDAGLPSSSSSSANESHRNEIAAEEEQARREVEKRAHQETKGGLFRRAKEIASIICNYNPFSSWRRNR